MITEHSFLANRRDLFILAAFILLPAAAAGGTVKRQITLKLVEPDGNALPRASIYKVFANYYNEQHGKEYICDNNGILTLDEKQLFQSYRQRKGVTLYGLYENKIAGFMDVNSDDLGKTIDMKLTPACLVYGTVKSDSLDNLNRKIKWLFAAVERNGERDITFSSRDGKYEFFLPAGEHTISIYTPDTFGKAEKIIITPGQKKLELNFELPASRTAYLVDNNAPEFQQIKGWLYSKPVSLKDLRGKVVMLNFWSFWSGPGIQSIPMLTELHEKYYDKGLVIIGINNDSMTSIEDLEIKIRETSKNLWNNKEIPFAVALDGGGQCKIEGADFNAWGATTTAYGIYTFPSTVLINKEGKVVGHYNGVEYMKVLTKLLGVELEEKQQSSPQAKSSAAQTQGPLAHWIGREPPELRQIKGWLNTEPLKLENLRGKIVLLDFWGTWCGPCISEIPELMELHNNYHAQDLVIIGVHNDSMNSIEDLKTKIEELSKSRWNSKKIPFAIALDGGGKCQVEGTQQTVKGATTAAYGINAFPTMILIDKQGKIVECFHFSKNSKMLGKLLGVEIKTTARPEQEYQSGKRCSAGPAAQNIKFSRILSGTITDTNAAKPITDAIVRISGPKCESAETDANGFYFFEGNYSDGDYRIAIDSNEYTGIYDYDKMPIVKLRADASTVKDFELDSACRIKLKVVDEASQPVENSEISVSFHDYDRSRRIGSDSLRRYTDKEGFCLVGGIPLKTSCIITATHGIKTLIERKDGTKRNQLQWDYAPGHLIVVMNNPEKIEAGKIVLQKGIDIAGVAKYQDGVPASDIEICAYPDWWSGYSKANKYPVDGNGCFTLRHVVPGFYQFMAYIPQKSGATEKPISRISLPLPDNEILKLTVPEKSPQALAAIRGRVVTKDGNFPDYVFINAYSPSGGHHDTSINPHCVREAQDTNFIIDRLEPGKYRLTFSSNGYEHKELEGIKAPSEGLVIELEPVEKIILSGSVVNPQNEPLQKFKARVKITQILRGMSYQQPVKWIEFNDPNGKFDFEARGPGIYKIQIAADNFAWTWSEDINTDRNFHAVIKMSPGGGIKGKVVNESGKPVKGAKVLPLSMAEGIQLITNSRRDPFVNEDGAAETRDDGRFELKHLAAGKESIKVIHPDYAYSKLDDIEIKEGQITESINVIMPSGGIVEGYVYGFSGEPQPNTTLFFQNPYDSEQRGRIASVTTDVNGYYRVTGLPEEFITVKRHEEWNKLGVVSRMIMPANGKMSRLDLGGKPNVRGRIIINGSPLVNRKILLSSPESPNSDLFRCSTITKSDGVFTFCGIPSGKWAIYSQSDENRNEWIKIAAFDMFDGDVELGLIEPILSTIRFSIEYEPGTSKWDTTFAYLQEGNQPWGQHVALLGKPVDENEPYVVKNILPGEYTLTLSRKDALLLRHPVMVNAKDVNMLINMPRCAAGITGQITSRQGQAIWREDKSIVGYIRPDADGYYALDNIPAGRYFIGGNMMIASGSFLDFYISDGEQKIFDVNVPDIFSQRLGSLQVDVIDQNGVAIPGAEVRLQKDAALISPLYSTGQRVHFLTQPGIYTLKVGYPGYHPVSKDVAIESVGNRKDVRKHIVIRLEPK